MYTQPLSHHQLIAEAVKTAGTSASAQRLQQCPEKRSQMHACALMFQAIRPHLHAEERAGVGLGFRVSGVCAPQGGGKGGDGITWRRCAPGSSRDREATVSRWCCGGAPPSPHPPARPGLPLLRLTAAALLPPTLRGCGPSSGSVLWRLCCCALQRLPSPTLPSAAGGQRLYSPASPSDSHTAASSSRAMGTPIAI